MTRRPLKPAGGIAGDSSGLTVRRNASAAVRDIEDGLVRAVARLGAAAGRMPIPDYACRRFQRAVVDAGSIPAASIPLFKPNPVCAECHAARGIESGSMLLRGVPRFGSSTIALAVADVRPCVPAVTAAGAKARRCGFSVAEFGSAADFHRPVSGG